MATTTNMTTTTAAPTAAAVAGGSTSTANANANANAEASKGGIPYYEKLRRDLRETLQKKRALDKTLVCIYIFYLPPCIPTHPRRIELL